MGLLIDPAESVLVVIDVQADFLARIEDETKAGLLERIAFLVESARYCEIPVIASVESPDDWGGLHPELVEPVGDAPVLRKVVFGLADDPLVGGVHHLFEIGIGQYLFRRIVAGAGDGGIDFLAHVAVPS